MGANKKENIPWVMLLAALIVFISPTVLNAGPNGNLVKKSLSAFVYFNFGHIF